MSFEYTYYGPRDKMKNYLVKNGNNYSDVRLETIDNKVIKIHKIIFASNIEYFDKLFKSGKDVYCISTTYKIISHIYNYLYYGCYEFVDIDDLVDCLLYTDKINYLEFFELIFKELDASFIDKGKIERVIGKLAKLKISNTPKIKSKILELSSQLNDQLEINELCEKSI